MLSWKEKVAEKLSRLLADSPSSPSSPTSPPVNSPVALPELQALPPEEFNSKKSPISSHFLSILHSTNLSINTQESNSPTHMHSITPSPVVSLPNQKANGSSLKDRPSDSTEENKIMTENLGMTEISKMNLDHFVKRDKLEEASTSSGLRDFTSYFAEKSVFIHSNLFKFFQSSLPNIVKGCQWVLLYSTWKHGISLRTLLRQTVDLPGPCLLIVGDTHGAVFGGLLDCPLKPTAKKKYQGTSQTFVFTTVYGEPRLFRATGANRYYYMCLNDVLAFGGGGSFALCLEEDLLHGSSGPCETFGNSCLAHSAEFELKDVELWGFAHPSHHGISHS